MAVATATPRPRAVVSGGRRLWGPALAACLLLALALRAPFFRLPLGIDEGGVAVIARHWGHGHGSLYGAWWLDRPPLLVALYRLAVADGADGVRALGAVAALALVVLAFALARLLGGDRAGIAAALVAALLTGSAALAAVFTPAELLAAVPGCASVLALLLAARRGDARWLVLAGALAVTALLVKQSFLDAGAAGTVFLAWRRRARWWAAYAAGAGAVLLALLAWAALAHVRLDDLAYALFGFRLRALRTLAGSSIPLQDRVVRLLWPLLRSGLAAALLLAAGGLWVLRRDRAAVVTLGAWMAAATVGVLAGGSYWNHYLIQLVPAAAVGAGVALGAAPAPAAGAALLAATVLAVNTTAAERDAVRHHHHREVLIGHWLRDHARPGDTAYVLYARANVGFYSDLPSPYPYAWSLMVRALPGARARLVRLLGSSSRPTWVVEWQSPSRWGLDGDGAIRRELRRGYRRAGRVGGRRILHRRPTSAAATPGEAPLDG